MGKKFVPELVQNNCTPQKLTQESIFGEKKRLSKNERKFFKYKLIGLYLILGD